MNKKEVKFHVEDIGEFVALIEAPVQGFISRRRRLADMIGSMSELIKLEADIFALQEKDRLTALMMSGELIRAQNILEMEDHVLAAPEGFTFDTMSAKQYETVWAAFEAARRPFRKEDRSVLPDDATPADVEAGKTANPE